VLACAVDLDIVHDRHRINRPGQAGSALGGLR
jgi:hypothetical protein